jgi:zinc transporter ZupT
VRRLRNTQTLYSGGGEGGHTHHHDDDHDSAAMLTAGAEASTAALGTLAPPTTTAAAAEAMAGYVGPTLLLGFLVMFLLDYFSAGHTHTHTHGHAHAHGHGTSDGHAHAHAHGGSSGDGAGSAAAAPPPFWSASFVGLLVHNVADGLAMGAASAGTDRRLEAIVFLAIILHKAPAAFGLCTVLLHQGHSRAVRGPARRNTPPPKHASVG